MPTLDLHGKEITFAPNKIIVSKTDLKGHITYANRTFSEVSGYSEAELLGKPHSIIRHDAMPRCVFKVIWDTIQAGQEIFGYVVNTTKSGDYYWVLAHVTPSLDAQGNITSYHSNRRVPDKKTIDTIISPLYAQLLQIEEASSNRKEGMANALHHLLDILKQKNMTYDEFVLSLATQEQTKLAG